MTATSKSAGSPISDRLLVLQFVRLLDRGGTPGDPRSRRGSLSRSLFRDHLPVPGVRRPDRGPDAASCPRTPSGSCRGRCSSTASRSRSAIGVTGGYRSPLLFLVFLDVMAVTVLASYRTGLKLAVWCALLLLLAARRRRSRISSQAARGRRAGHDRERGRRSCCSGPRRDVLVGQRTGAAPSRAQLERLVRARHRARALTPADDVPATLVRHRAAASASPRAAVLVRGVTGLGGGRRRRRRGLLEST